MPPNPGGFAPVPVPDVGVPPVPPPSVPEPTAFPPHASGEAAATVLKVTTKGTRKSRARRGMAACRARRVPPGAVDAYSGLVATTETASPEDVPANDAIRGEWLRRVEAEYRSAAITQHLVLWLIQIGASPDLLNDGLRVVSDELVHAELSHDVYVAAGGEGAPTLVRESLGLPRSRDPLEHDVLRVGLETFCLGETAAVRLFKELRDECTVEPARVALDRVLVDEVRHRDFGWALLDWMLSTPLGDTLHRLAVAELPSMFVRLRRQYAPAFAGDLDSIDPAARQWGLMSVNAYAKTLELVLERDYLPRFSEVDIDARAAWARGPS